MIASVSGSVQSIGKSAVIVRAGNFGVSVLATATTLRSLRIGQEVELLTSLQVREDSLTLYGFSDDGQLSTFELLLTVSGIGPKVALSIIDSLTPAQIANAIQQDDDSVFRSVSGVGPKTAKLIILALSGKVTQVSSSKEPSNQENDLVEAIANLGWPSAKIRDAISQGDISKLTPAEAIREILRRLAAK